MKNKWNKSIDLNLQIPESALNHITEQRKKSKREGTIEETSQRSSTKYIGSN